MPVHIIFKEVTLPLETEVHCPLSSMARRICFLARQILSRAVMSFDGTSSEIVKVDLDYSVPTPLRLKIQVQPATPQVTPAKKKWEPPARGEALG